MSILRKMKKLRLNSQVRKAFQGNSRGFSLVEIVIAIALLGVIAVAILGSLSYASTVLIIADSRATAESLAKSQMEYVKSQGYNSTQPGGIATYPKIPDEDIPVGYIICSVNRDGQTVNCGGSDGVIGIPWDSGNDSGNNTAVNIDNGLQKIRLIISYDILRYNISTHGSEVVQEQFTLEGYKREPVT